MCQSKQHFSGIAPYDPKAFKSDWLGSSPFGHPYCNRFNDKNPAVLAYPSIRDNIILALSHAIREKPEWWIKYNNPEILAKWKEEWVIPEDDFEDLIDTDGGKSACKNIVVDPDLFDYVIAELAWYEKIRNSTNNQFQLTYSDYVFYGDNVVPPELKKRFVAAEKKLEDIPEDLRDWHPGSKQRVWDLVHPSLYPLHYGVTPIVKDFTDGHVGLELSYKGPVVIAPHFSYYEDSKKRNVMEFGVSKKFQWLPSIFNVSKGGEVTIESYINNLHPVKHKDLYQPIADIFACFVSGINAALTQYASKKRIRDIPLMYETPTPNESSYYYSDECLVPTYEDPVFEMPSEDTLFKIDVHETKLKVIVKLANIELTPERPNYEGGTWHVEGTINEDIVCTCLYYYDVENITDDSELEFRAAVATPIYERDDEETLMESYGLKREDINVFPQGSVKTIQDRMIVFPNMLQHHVTPFELKDKSKPGHRKILCFFVCDPYDDSVISTDQVPPQQRDWWLEEVLANKADGEGGDGNVPKHTIFDQLPTEILTEIFDKVEWPMSLDRAKKLRKKLMKERTRSKEEIDTFYQHDDPFFRRFSLCEH